MSLLKGLVKLVIGKSAKKAGVGGSGAYKIMAIADQLIDDDQEIQEATNAFIVTIEGKYSELRTKAEGIVKSMTRPFLTILFSVNVILWVWLDIDIPMLIVIATTTLIGSWCGTKGIRDWNKFKVKKAKKFKGE